MSADADSGRAKYESLSQFASTRWGNRHRVIQRFIPFESRGCDPLEVLVAIRETIENTRKTALTIQVSKIEEFCEYSLRERTSSLQPLFAACGSWSPGEKRNSAKIVNPEYCHGVPEDLIVRDADERERLIREITPYGVVTKDYFCVRFGITRRTLNGFLNRHDISWNEIRQEGRERFVRTLALLYEWGYTYREIGEAFGYSAEGVRSCVRRVDGFDVPDDPTKL